MGKNGTNKIIMLFFTYSSSLSKPDARTHNSKQPPMSIQRLYCVILVTDNVNSGGVGEQMQRFFLINLYSFQPQRTLRVFSYAGESLYVQTVKFPLKVS